MALSGPDREGRRPRRGPTPLGDALGELFAARGLGRLRAVGELEEAWAEAVGPAGARQSRVAGLRHGVLTVQVAHPALLQELAAFRKAELLAALRAALPDVPLHDLRFRVGPVDPPDPGAPRDRRRGGAGTTPDGSHPGDGDAR